MKKVLALLLALVMLTAVLAGCGSKDAAPAGTDSAADTTDTATPADSGDSAAVPASAASGKILTFGCQMYSDGLINPASQTNCAWNCMRFGVGEALFKFNDSMEVEPWLAESAETADNITWTIKLKDGILFSNGDPMTATKVKESLDWVREEGPNGSSNPQKYLPFEAEITADDAANTITIVLPTANMNQAEGRPLANDTLRQAILMAIDYKTICASNTIGNLYTPGFSVLPSTLAYGYDKLTNPWETNMDAAKKLLDDAGIVDTDGDGIRELDGQNINLTYVSYENRMLNDFSDAHTLYLTELGIGVTAKYGSSDDQWNSLVAGEYDFNNNNWTTVGNGDPTEYMANWYSKSGADYCNYVSDEYDALYEQLLEETDSAKRADIIQQLQQILVDDAAVLVDGYYNSSMAYSKNVGYAHIHTADYYWLTTEITPAA